MGVRLIVGFTGTQDGMTPAQLQEFERRVRELGRVDEFHHGDCIGADDEAANVVAAVTPKPRIVCHPPINESKRAFNKHSDEVLGAYEYLERNRDIVNAVTMLFVCPKEMQEIQRSGTWSTYRYARRRSKRIVVVFPDGSVVEYA